jgi:diacylglycerol kinase (ATP)
MKILIIQNPYSSRWTSQKKTGVMLNALASAGLEFDHVQTKGPNHAIELAAQAVKDGYEAIIAAGGDGTIGEVVNGIMQGSKTGKRPIFGIMPLGTANDLVNNLKQPVDCLEMAKIIAAGKTKMIDVCQVNDRYFLNNAGLGLEPFTTTIQEKIKRIQGIARYLVAVIISIIKNPQWKMKLIWDGGEYEGPITLVSVSNGPVTGGLFYTVPSADLFDGKLSFVYGHIKSRFEIFKVLPKMMKSGDGNYTDHPSIHEAHCTKLKVQIEPTTPAHTDGELFDRAISEVEYKIYPSELPIFVE